MSRSPIGGTHGAGVVRPASTVPTKHVAAGAATEMQVLVGTAEGAPNFVMRRFIMGERGGMPMHTNRVEHEQYVLRGKARVTIAGTAHEVGPDDTLFIPAGAPHSYEVLQAPFEFLCIVPNASDEIRLVEGTG